MYINIYCTGFCLGRNKTNKQKKISVDKWVVLKQEKKETFSVCTAYIFKHWRRRRVKKTVALVLMSDISVTVVLKALWLWQRQLTTSGLTKNHLSTGNSRISEDLRWGVRPAASHLRLTDLNTLPCPRVKSSSRCLTWLWSPTSLCVCMNPLYSCVWSSYVDSGLVRLLQPLGLLLQGGGVGSLRGRSVQRVGSSAHQRGDGAAHGGHRVFGCHVFYREDEEDENSVHVSFLCCTQLPRLQVWLWITETLLNNAFQ